MSTTKTMFRAVGALAMLVACGGVDPMPSPATTPDAGQAEETEKAIAVSGRVELVDGEARVALDVAVDDAQVTDARVLLGGQVIGFDADEARYVARLAEIALAAEGSLELEVTHGSTSHTRALVFPGTFEVQAPASVALNTAVGVSWSAAAGATAYRASLASGATVEVSPESREYTFDGVDTAGPMLLAVTAISRSVSEGARIDVRRIERRTVTILDEQTNEEPEPVVAVSGRIVIDDGIVDVNLDVMLDGEWNKDAEVTICGTEVPFVPAAHGFAAQLPVSELPAAGPFVVAVVIGDVTHTRSILVPGQLVVSAPESVEADSVFNVTWNAVENATSCRLWFGEADGSWRSAEFFMPTRIYGIDVSAPGEAGLRMTAVTDNVDKALNSAVEVLRIARRTVTVLAE